MNDISVNSHVQYMLIIEENINFSKMNLNCPSTICHFCMVMPHTSADVQDIWRVHQATMRIHRRKENKKRKQILI